MNRLPAGVAEAGAGRSEPTYVYDLDELDRRCDALESIPVTRKRIHFATMANDHPGVLSRVRDRGHGVFVNSPAHLQLALDVGFDPERVVYAATNMTAAELQDRGDASVGLVLDSLGQVELLGAVDSVRQIALRVDVGSALDGGPFGPDGRYRFGLLPSELPRALRVSRELGVSITGAHAYFGTDFTSPDSLLRGLERLCDVSESLPDCAYVDVAGGFGIGDDGEFDLAGYGAGAAAILASHRRRTGVELELVLEPGRYVAASCGYFFVTVTDVKRRADRTFVGTNGSVAIFPRPLIYPDRASHPCAVLGANGRAPHALPVYVCGNSTYSRDFLGSNLRLPLPQLGERLVFGYAGAYCRSMITRFLGMADPVEVVLGAVHAPTPAALAG